MLQISAITKQGSGIACVFNLDEDPEMHYFVLGVEVFHETVPWEDLVFLRQINSLPGWSVCWEEARPFLGEARKWLELNSPNGYSYH